jgi:hypothetical protein
MSYDANFAMLEDERAISLPRGLKSLTLSQGLDALDDMPDAKQERDQTARDTHHGLWDYATAVLTNMLAAYSLH